MITLSIYISISNICNIIFKKILQGHYLGYGVLAGIATLVAIMVILKTIRNLRRKTEYNRLT